MSSRKENDDHSQRPVAPSRALLAAPLGAPFGPTDALLGTVTGSGVNAEGNPLKWTDPTAASTPVNATENPTLGDTEDWEVFNLTTGAQPIHLYLLRFEVIGGTLFDGSPSPNGNPQPWERGFKNTVMAYSGGIRHQGALTCGTTTSIYCEGSLLF